MSSNRLRRVAVAGSVLVLLMALGFMTTAISQAQSSSSLSPFVTETGRVSLSLDAVGTSSSTGIVEVEKPAGATVRSAYLAAASTGFSNRVLNNGDVAINGVGVTFSQSTPSSISSSNHLADVTSIVKPTIDAAAPGRVQLTISEVSSTGIDGVILAVIFDDPSQPTDNTVVLLFGAQNVNGDTFSARFAEPIDKTDPAFALQMSLGISFGAQGTDQFSFVDVNGQRLTSAAGGQDDGVLNNGALITVGGLDDLPTNPANPFAPPTGPRSDDELYDLEPFVQNGDTTATISTSNPSNDDNIFFAAFFFRSAVAVVGEGIILSPGTATNPVGTQHTVTATVQDTQGNPVANRTVTFTVVSGPHAGLSGTAQTNSSGQATFTYTGSTAGIDTIEASFVDSQGATRTSNQVTKEWVGGQTDATPPSCVLTATGKDANGKTYLQVTAQDTGSGIASIQVVKSTNANTVVPAFTSGTTDPLVVVATKINQSKSSQVALRVTDVAGNVTDCDPIMTVVIKDAGKPETQTFTDVPTAEGVVTISNGSKGIKNLDITVNGRNFKITGLKDGETRTVDISSAMQPGDGNTISLSARGPKGATAEIMIWDGVQ